MKTHQKIVQKLLEYLLIGTLVFFVINYIAIGFADTPHEIRNEVMAFYFGPIVTLGKIIYILAGSCKGNGGEIYGLLSGPDAIQFGNYAPSTFFKVLTAIIGISWTAFLVYLVDSIQFKKPFNSCLIKIPLLIGAIIVSLIIIYWLNGNGNTYYFSRCLP